MGISVTDKPIERRDESLLGIDNYAGALTEFILESNTPLTLGLQGIWGSGKTSLMNLIQEALGSQGIATSWVNTWEYSLFRGAEETMPAVLKAMLEQLKASCGERWTLNDDRMENIRRVFSAFGNIAGQVVESKTGISANQARDAMVGTEQAQLAEVADLKKSIASIINDLINDERNQFDRVVFFLDDLDRIDPPVAVEILEALKNIFDIDHCIFVLAIDYDVVVKGLEKKFGPKTKENEREFRSFFDKIIQVPFSMPIAGYDTANLFRKLSEKLGLVLPEQHQDNYLSMVELTVGSIPRSIKRYINSYSLLRRIHQSDDPNLDFCLFALLGIQISYPSIYQLLARRSAFSQWDTTFAASHGIDLNSATDDIDTNHQYLDETWEQFVWLYCQRDPYLRTRSHDILEILNRIREALGDQLIPIMEEAIATSAMTSVDDSANQAVRPEIDADMRWQNRKASQSICEELNQRYLKAAEGKQTIELIDGDKVFKTYQPRGSVDADSFCRITTPDGECISLEFYIRDDRVDFNMEAHNRRAREAGIEFLRNNLPALGVEPDWDQDAGQLFLIAEEKLDSGLSAEERKGAYREWIQKNFEPLFERFD